MTLNRAAIKEAAKQDLSRHYWLALAAALLTGGGSMLGFVGSGFHVNLNFNGQSAYPPLGIPPFLTTGILFVLGVAMLISLAYSLLKFWFVGGPLRVGGARYFLNIIRGEDRFGAIAHGFLNTPSGAYRRTCKTVFLMALFIGLWGLLPFAGMLTLGGAIVLFSVTHVSRAVVLSVIPALVLLTLALFIPMYVKSYEYQMIPYLLAEHPEMDAAQAFAATKQLTYGCKGELFVLDLSFIGWYLLGTLCCGIGVLFVLPYHEAAKARAYAAVCAAHTPKSQLQQEGE